MWVLRKMISGNGFHPIQTQPKFGKVGLSKINVMSDWSSVCKVESRFGVEVNNGEGIEAGAAGA